jgi:hypothetical protein
MFRVDVRGARQILAQLPRLVARDLPNSEARRHAARLREVGGVALVCGSGERPDFDAVAASTRRAEGVASRTAARAPAVTPAPFAAPETGPAFAASAATTTTPGGPAPRSAATVKTRRAASATAPARVEVDLPTAAAVRSAQDAAMAN